MINETTNSPSLTTLTTAGVSLANVGTSAASLTTSSTNAASLLTPSFGITWAELTSTWAGYGTWALLTDNAQLTNL